MLLQRDRLEIVLVGITRHLHERPVALPHRFGLETGLDAVEADHGVRHGGDPSFLAMTPDDDRPTHVVADAIPLDALRVR